MKNTKEKAVDVNVATPGDDGPSPLAPTGQPGDPVDPIPTVATTTTAPAGDEKPADTAAAAKPAAPKRTALEIAIARGWMPSDGSTPRSTREWPNWWKYSAAFAGKPAGWEVTEADFDKAVDTAINSIHG